MNPRTQKLAWRTVLPYVIVTLLLLFATRCASTTSNNAEESREVSAATMWDNLEEGGRPDPVARFNAYWEQAKDEPWLFAGGKTVVVCNSGQLAATDNAGQCKKLLPCFEPEWTNYYPGGWRQYADDKRACTICSCTVKHH